MAIALRDAACRERLAADLGRARREAEAHAARAEDAERRVRQIEERYGALLGNLPDVILRYDRNLGYLYVSSNVERVTGIPLAAFEGRSLGFSLPEAVRLRHEEALRTVFASGREQSLEWAMDASSGVRHFQTRIVPEFDGEGRIESALAVSRDITALMLMEADLRRAKEAAEAASRAKSEFLANMSHEIRTPMNGVLGMTELAMDLAASPKAKEYLRLARQSGLALLEIINDILDLSKVEAGKIELDQAPFDLRDLLAEMAESLEVSARQKGLELLLSIDPEAPRRLRGDKGRLRQILTNLIGNGLKFTERGRVGVAVSLAEVEDGQVTLLFSVVDEGVGIPPDRQASIFEPFSQGGRSSHVKYGGTGLGLTISKTLVELMGGRIWVVSGPGRGSTFHFTARFGLGRAGAEPLPAEDRPVSPPVRRLRTLLVEDNQVNRLLGVEMLTRKGYLVDVAENGLQALEKLRIRAFDVVFMDIRMPVLDGLEAIRRIRLGQAGNPAIPIIAMTAYALKGDEDRFLDAGADGYLAKPVTLTALDRVVESVLPSSLIRSARAEESCLPGASCN